MSYVFSGKIQSAMFVDPPHNTVIELLYGEGTELTAFHLDVNYSNDEFLAFIDEWPLEKVEQTARENARTLAIEIQKRQNTIVEVAIDSKKIFDYIIKNNNNNTDVFDIKLIILERAVALKDKSLKLRIRKAKTILDLLQIYNEII